MIITLSKPIQAHGEEVTELELGDLTLGQLKGIDLVKIGDPAILIRIVAKWAGIPPSSVEAISAKDFKPLVEAVSDFLDVSPETGET